jgi:pimeloyl-ACP methyl ester carboxylesterase
MSNQITPRWNAYDCAHGGIHYCDSNGPQSGISYDPVSSKHVVVNSDGARGLDVLRNIGSLDIKVPIRRYVGADLIKASSTNIDTLSKMATLSFVVHTPKNPSCRGVDNVYLNGLSLGPVTGMHSGRTSTDTDGSWKEWKIEVPINKLKFPVSPGEVGNNFFSIDTNVQQCSDWNVIVDWVKIDFKAGPVVVFVHGINSDGGSWQTFHDYLSDIGVVSDNSITLTYADFNKQALRRPELCATDQFTSTGRNSSYVIANLMLISHLYGTGELTLVAHSKGGMDSKAAIKKLDTRFTTPVGSRENVAAQENLSIQSLVTINTPHLGTPAADLGILKVLEENSLTKGGEFGDILGSAATPMQYLYQAGALNYLLGKNYLCDLTTEKGVLLNSQSAMPSNSFGTNTNAASSSQTINWFDAVNFGPAPSFLALDVVQRLYFYMGSTKKISFYRDVGSGLYTALPYYNTSFEPNDILVSQTSAKGLGIPMVIDAARGLHHTSVVQNRSVQELIKDKALQGAFGVDWRAK